MSAPPMTRRSVLALGAGALTAGLTWPVGALAALGGPPPPTLEEHWIGRLGPAGATVELARSADLVGVEWRAPAVGDFQLRVRGAGGSWSSWVAAGAHGHGPEGRPQSDRLIGEPVWTGGATAVQLRSTRTLTGVRLHLVDVSGGVGARRQALSLGPLASAAALPQATPVLNAGAGQPPIIARSAWAQGMAPPRVAPEYGAVELAFVHHTENPNGYAPGEVPAMLRAIYVFHRYVNGWNDIGYNFVLDLYGRIFEARAGGIDEPVVGAHAGGYNLLSTGVAVLGSFMSTAISLPAHRALQRLLAWKLSLHGLPAQGRVTVRVNPAGASYSRFPANAHVPLPRIAGHRDGDSTDCPGDVLYGELPAVRAAVARLAPNPVRATLALGVVAAAPPSGTPVPPATTPSTPSPAPGTPVSPAQPTAAVPVLTGRLALLDETPIAGATVLLQARAVARRGEQVSERTIAEAVTDAEGRWTLPRTLPGAPTTVRTSLRVLYTGASGHGAAVSEPLRVPPGALLAPPTPASTPPTPAPAPTAPAAAPPAP